jgi:phosphoglycolate phosphatase-like HAD superfamily hydrolase
MTTQTIPEYLEEERQKATDNQLRTEEEAARIQPLQHGHHRMAKQPKLELLPPVKAVARKKTKRKTVAVATKKPRTATKIAARKIAAKTRKRV